MENLTAYPKTLGEIVPAYTYKFTPQKAVVAMHGGKLYFIAAHGTGGIVEVFDNMRAMYPKAVFFLHDVAENHTLPMLSDFQFYEAYGVEWREVNIPFSGFYNSWHDDAIERELQQIFSDENGCNYHSELWQIGFDGCDHSSVFLDYSRDYVESFATECGIYSARFSGMESPREYNFSSDRVFAKITLSELRRIHAATDSDTLDAMARERFTSRSGFISSYSNDPKEWGDLADWDHNQTGTLIRAYWDDTQDEWNTETEFALMEDASGNGYLGNWVWDALNDKAERAANLAYKLRERCERKTGNYDATRAAFDGMM